MNHIELLVLAKEAPMQYQMKLAAAHCTDVIEKIKEGERMNLDIL